MGVPFALGISITYHYCIVRNITIGRSIAIDTVDGWLLDHGLTIPQMGPH